MKRLILIATIFVLFSSFIGFQSWQPVEGSVAHFKIRGLFGMYVKGTLGDMKAEIDFDEKAPERASISASVSAATIKTGIKKRDAHLRSDDFLDAEKYPLITFKSSSVSRNGEAYLAKGTLTIKDVSDTISIPFTVETVGNNRLFRGAFAIDRTHYHVGKKMIGMGKTVKVDLTVFCEQQRPR